MTFLRLPFPPELPPPLHGQKVMLRVPVAADHEAWSSLRQQSRSFLTPWEPVWPDNDLLRPAFRSRIKHYWREIESDSSYPYFIFASGKPDLLGAITISNVRRGVAQMGTLGYWIGAPHARQGYMSEALQLMKHLAFGHLGLHRLEAACLPTNAPSMALLKRAGFTQEGYAKAYLKIAGVWQDHQLFSCISPQADLPSGP